MADAIFVCPRDKNRFKNLLSAENRVRRDLWLISFAMKRVQHILGLPPPREVSLLNAHQRIKMPTISGLGVDLNYGECPKFTSIHDSIEDLFLSASRSSWHYTDNLPWGTLQ